jgi:hypothetical protein
MKVRALHHLHTEILFLCRQNPALQLPVSKQVEVLIWAYFESFRPVELKVLHTLRYKEFVKERTWMVQDIDEQSKVIHLADLRDRWQERVNIIKQILYGDGALDCTTRNGATKRTKNPKNIAAELQTWLVDGSGKKLDYSWVHPGHIKQAQYELRHGNKAPVQHRRHRQRHPHIG